ncbi:hypothetical protein GGR54DRAFT_643827 [Hypoxylon sp. NC1633]|nr:hypothetical protein GGR54DRAFT_643827 [Hypoxylon sp. NC1633]
MSFPTDWYRHTDAPEFTICSWCYVDHILGTQFKESFRSEQLTDGKPLLQDHAHEKKEFPSFWTDVRKLANEKFCEDNGIEDGVWSSLPSDPSDFGLCTGCYNANDILSGQDGAKPAASQVLNATSLFRNSAGMLQEITYGSTHMYGIAGVGYSFANQNILQGAMYGQQAAATGASVASGASTLLVGQFRRRWGAVV